MLDEVKALKLVVEELEKLTPDVEADAVKHRKSYQQFRELTLSAQAHIKVLREKSLEKFNHLWYEPTGTHKRKVKK